MSRKKSPETKKKHPVGRPLTKIDWDEVEKLTIKGCLGSDIAGVFGMHPHTFYDHVEKKHGIKFSEFRQQFHSKGDAYLRVAQYNKAIKGDNSMLIWLGKNRLGQTDKAQTEVDEDLIRKVVQFLSQQLPAVKEPCRPEMAPEQPLLHQNRQRQEDSLPNELGSD